VAISLGGQANFGKTSATKFWAVVEPFWATSALLQLFPGERKKHRSPRSGQANFCKTSATKFWGTVKPFWATSALLQLFPGVQKKHRAPHAAEGQLRQNFFNEVPARG